MSTYWPDIGSWMLTCSDRRNPAQIDMSYHTNRYEWVRKGITKSSTVIHDRKRGGWCITTARMRKLASMSETPVTRRLLAFCIQALWELINDLNMTGRSAIRRNWPCVLRLQDTTCESLAFQKCDTRITPVRRKIYLPSIMLSWFQQTSYLPLLYGHLIHVRVIERADTPITCTTLLILQLRLV
jgi:hypothetical protein